MPMEPGTFGLSPSSEKALLALCRIYAKGHGVCLFTGAGVSFTNATRYRTPGWRDLLAEVYEMIHPTEPCAKVREGFLELERGHKKPWNLAQALFEECDSNRVEFERLLRAAIVGRASSPSRRRPTSDDTYQRLARAFLLGAPTLNAVIAFCSHLRAIREHPCFLRNPRVPAVLTSNYDCFLEAGATLKWEKRKVPKPLSWTEWAEIKDVDEELGSYQDRLPVYHIHGYLPYRSVRPRHPLVLTRQEYRVAYAARGFARGTIDRILGRHSALFVGFSFDDELLNQRLKSLASQKGSPAHFAFLKEGEGQRATLQFLKEASVRPILYASHDQIPALLGYVYQAGLKVRERVKLEGSAAVAGGPRYRRLSPGRYWATLLEIKK